MTRGLWRLLAGFVLFAACSPGEVKAPVAGEAEPLPKLQVSPRPGAYQQYELAVTVTTDADHELYFAFDTAPVIEPGRGTLGKLKLRLVHSSHLWVAVRSPSGKVFGPYDYEYDLIRVNPEGACELTEPAREFYRASDKVYLSLQYIYSNALSRLEFAINGDWQPVATDDYQGALDLEIGPFAEGDYAAQCRMVTGKTSIVGDLVAFKVDGTPPFGAWPAGGFTFDQASWRNGFEISAGDAYSGLAAVDLCNAVTAACLPMAAAGGAQFRFATALTDGTRLASDLYVRLEDRAGNTFQLPAQTLDLLGYPDPVPARAPLAVTVTTAATLDLAAVVGAGLAEVRRFDGAAPAESATALALAPGWNEFLYRPAGTGHWRSFAVYRAGVDVFLPPTAGQWLVYASGATVPGLQARLEAVVVPANPAAPTLFSRPWLDAIPHLFFVEDLDADARWTQADALYQDPTTGWNGTLRAYGEAVRIEAPAAFVPAAFMFTRQVTVAVAAGMPAADLYFEWRENLYAFPSYHARLTAAAFPRAVSVPGDGVCLFFLDVDAQGSPSGEEPRAWGPCTQNDFVVDSRLGLLDAVAVPSYPLPWILGIPYGGAVTGVITVTDSLGQPLVAYPTAPVADVSGLGAEGYYEGFETRYPQLPMQVDFYLGAESAPWGPIAAAEAPPPGLIAVSVTDAAGAPVQALVVSLAENQQRYAAADAGGQATVAAGGAAPYVLYAARDGWLSAKKVTDGTSAGLTLLPPALTGLLSGVVRDGAAPVAGAEVVWENERYRASAISREDGSYALPASGGAGELTVSVRTFSASRSTRYPLWVTTTAVTFDPAVPQTPDPADPTGLAQGYPPASVTGPATATLAADNFSYSAAISGPAAGVWSANWNGFQRYVSLPGALPQFPSVTWSAVPLPSGGGALAWLTSYARCGEWEQPANGVLLAQWPCWHWLAGDGLQIFTLGRPLAGVYPALTGFGVAQGGVTRNDGSPIGADVTLRLVDKLLQGRTVLVRVSNGFFSAAVPAGIYEVQDEDGAALIDGFQPATLSIAADGFASLTLRLPY